MDGRESAPLVELVLPTIPDHLGKRRPIILDQLEAEPQYSKVVTPGVMADKVIQDYNERHGSSSKHCVPTLTKVFAQWVSPFLSRTLKAPATSESQLSRWFDHANTGVYVHQSAPQEPQEPRTPEQATHIIPAVTPPKLELRAVN